MISLLTINSFPLTDVEFANLRDAGFLVQAGERGACLSAAGVHHVQATLRRLATVDDYTIGQGRRVVVTRLASNLTYAGRRRRGVIDLYGEKIYLDRQLPKKLLDQLIARASKIEPHLHAWANDLAACRDGESIRPGLVIAQSESLTRWCRRFVDKSGDYACPRCERTYATSMNFCRHLRDDHDVEPNAQALRLSAYPPHVRHAERMTPFYSDSRRTGPIAETAAAS